MNNKKWIVVLDDSDCTVGVGGEGYLWEVNKSDDCYYRPNGVTPYPKYMFRDATEQEVENWKQNKQRANVPKIHGRKLYRNW
jgi:hypothetical protein